MRMSLEGYSLQPPSLGGGGGVGGKEKPLGVPSNTAELLFCKEPRALGRICAARQWRGMTNRQDWSSLQQEFSNTGMESISNTASQIPSLLYSAGTAHSLRPLYPRAGGSWLVPSGSIPTPLSLSTPVPRDGILAHSYLSHSCLHNLQAQLMLQLSFHLLCGQGGDGQRHVSPPHKRPPRN